MKCLLHSTVLLFVFIHGGCAVLGKNDSSRDVASVNGISDDTIRGVRSLQEFLLPPGIFGGA